MPEYPVWKAQQEPQAPSSEGTLRISVVSSVGMIPIQHATVTISYTGDPQTPLMTLSTDESGQTPPVSLPAPNLEYSLEPEQLVQPYSEYNIEVTAEGYEPVLVSGTEVLPDVTAIQYDPAGIKRTGRGYLYPGTYTVRRISAENSRRRNQTNGRIR